MLYGFAMQCPVPSYAIVLRLSYAMSSSELGYAATRRGYRARRRARGTLGSYARARQSLGRWKVKSAISLRVRYDAMSSTGGPISGNRFKVEIDFRFRHCRMDNPAAYAHAMRCHVQS
eukprot:2935359-Rhodomonas_salina.3